MLWNTFIEWRSRETHLWIQLLVRKEGGGGGELGKYVQKIWIRGTPVVEEAVEEMSPMQKQTDIKKINPVIAPR